MIARAEPLTAAATPDSEEHQLIEAARAGDKDAWSRLFGDYYQPLYRYALLRVREHHAAEELASQVFEEAFRGIKRFRYRGVSIRAWLYRIARNLSADYLRKRARLATSELVETASPNDLSVVGVRMDIVAALVHLPDDQQQVIVLRFVQGLSLAESAHVLGRSADAVSALQARALLKMRDALKEDDR